MTPSDRYDTSSLPEAQFEPGSNDQVLRNKLGITSPDEMDSREKEEQLKDMITKDKDEYIRAIQIGFGGNYVPMEKVFGDVICKTLRVRELK